MSAFQLSDKHISYLVNALRQTKADDHTQIPAPDGPEGFMVRASCVTDTDLGQYLQSVNDESVNYRYSHRTDLEAPAPFRYDSCYRIKPLDHVQVIKAAQCYEYQSCEYPGWKESPADKLMQGLINHAISSLPGYDAAEWSID